MYFIKKFIKQLNHIIFIGLNDITDNNEYLVLYNNIYEVCSNKFYIEHNIEHNTKITEIYNILLENIKKEFNDTIYNKIMDEFNVNDFTIEDVVVIFNNYNEKIKNIEAILVYFYSSAEEFIPKYNLQNYEIKSLYIFLWDADIFNKISLRLTNNICDVFNVVRKNNYNKDSVYLNSILYLFSNNFSRRYTQLINTITQKSISFYTNLYNQECTDLKSLNVFFNKYSKIETNIIEQYNYKSKKLKDYRVISHINKICYWDNIENLKKYIKTYIINIKNSKNEYDYEEIEVINIFYINLRKFILPGTIEIIIDEIVKPLHNIIILDKQDIYSTIIEINYLYNILFVNKSNTNSNTNTCSTLFKNTYLIYIDTIIDKTTIENDINTIINKLMQKNSEDVFKYLCILDFLDYELMETLYKKSLSKRIISGRYNLNLERNFINEIKNNNVFRIKKMLSDVNNTQILLNENNENNENNLDSLNLVIGTNGIWPFGSNNQIYIPKSFEKTKNSIEEKYKLKYPNRNLEWNTNILNAIVKYKKYELQIGGIYVDFLNMFNETDNIYKTNIDYTLYNKKKIKKFVDIKLILEDDEKYTINDNFSYTKKKIILL